MTTAPDCVCFLVAVFPALYISDPVIQMVSPLTILNCRSQNYVVTGTIITQTRESVKL